MLRAPVSATAPASPRRVFDCFLFNGEMDVLAIRLHELSGVVDCFVIVESDKTFSGMPRTIGFDPSDSRVSAFASRLRHVVVADMPETEDPWMREKWQRNAMLRGVPDAADTDLIMLSDVDEIPRAAVVRQMAEDRDNEVFGFRLAFSYFYVNYRNVGGPETAVTWNVAATRGRLADMSADDLRYAVRDGRQPAQIFEEGGWHFSYLMDAAGIRRKIAAFSHQEYNASGFLDAIDIRKTVRRGDDLFRRAGFQWKVLPEPDLPAWLHENRRALRHLFCATGLRGRIADALAAVPATLRRRTRPRPAPVVICPYLYEHEADEIIAKFRLDGRSARHVRFHLWQDKEALGPEFAFEHCWNQFPEHDIIIVHSDMAPQPGRPPMEWYDALVGYRDSLPAAGMIACNLYHPNSTSGGPVSVQCAGGMLRDGKIDWLHGGVDEPDGVPSEVLRQVRCVDWVTFGGVLIRRELIRACGPLDRRYEWAYVMDVDYSFEARLRGFRLMQVPASLVHEENRTTRSLWEQQPALLDALQRNFKRFYAKWQPFYPALIGYTNRPNE